MLKRAQGVHHRDRLLYQLGAKRFANLQPMLYEVAEILLAFLLRPHADEVAFLFSSLNRATRQLFRTTLMQLPPPQLGDANPWCDWPPVFRTLRERVGWVFVRCHMCDEHAATDRVGLALVDETRMATAMVCRGCRGQLWMQRIANRFLELQGGRLVIVGVETLGTGRNVAHNLALFKANMDGVRVRITRVAEQKWLLPIANSRQARRSVPFETRFVPPLKLETCMRRVTELIASVKLSGGPQTDFRLAIAKDRADALLTECNSQALLRLLVTTGLPLRARRVLLERMTTTAPPPPMSTELRDGRKLGTSAVWRRPKRACSHAFGSRLSMAKCLRCSACNGT